MARLKAKHNRLLVNVSAGLLLLTVAGCAGRGRADAPASDAVGDLASNDPGRRRKTVRRLGEAPDEARRHVPALLAAMDDPDAEVRWRAEFALGRVGREGVPAVAAGLSHPEARVRRAAAYVLGPMGPKARAAVPALLPAARDADPSVRVWAVMGLGLIAREDPQVIQAVTEALGDADEDVIRVALRIVIKLGPEAKAAVPALLKVLEHPRGELRWMTGIAFRQIGPDAAAAAPALVNRLTDPDPDVRARAAQALSRIGAAATPVAEAALKDPTRREAAAQVLQEIRMRTASAVTPAESTTTSLDPNAAARSRWYNEAKFGLFIHWGLYAVGHRARPGQLSEWLMDNEKIPVAEYQKLAAGFTAERFDPAEWVRLARDTGARYMVLTSKHHDGFSLWDTKTTPYNAAQFAPAKRDVIAELAGAAEKGGVKLALYYSFLDWHHPDYQNSFPRYVDWMHGQIRELLTRYPIWGLWFDGEWTKTSAEWRGNDIIALARKLRPMAFINDRLGRETRGALTTVDFYTKEQEIPPAALKRQNRPVAWETCQTFGYSWGYNESPDALRSGERLIEELVEVVSKGGNFLLNIGPRPDGSIPEFFQARMAVIGRWMKKNGEAIYGTERSPFPAALPAGRVTTKGNMIYVFLDQRPTEGILLPGLQTAVKRAYLLDGGAPLEVSKRGDTQLVSAPAALTDPTYTVVAIELTGTPVVN